MTRISKYLAVAAGMSLTGIFCAGAQAQDAVPFSPAAFYVSVFGSVPLLDSLAFESHNTVGKKLGAGTISLNNGFGADAAVGYDFGNGLMLEGQAGYLHSNVTNATFTQSPPGFSTFAFGATGSVDATYAMVNLWYGLHLGPVTPFVGGGFGAADLSITTKYAAPFAASSFSDSATTHAAQIGGGLSVDLTDNIAITARFRHFFTGEVTLTDGGGDKVTASYATNIIDVGLKIKF
jgi:opacity protein-like surface antigen